MGRLILLYSHPQVGEQRFDLVPGKVYRVGSRQENDIVIMQKDVSRHHCIIAVAEGGLRVTDLDSKNGTFINGKRVVTGEFECGDSLSLSSASLVVLEEDEGQTGAEAAGEVAAPTDGSAPRDETVKYRDEPAIGDMVELLEITAAAVRKGAISLPLSWAVDRFGLEGALILYCDSSGSVAMVTTAGNPGQLVVESARLSQLVQDEIVGASDGPTLRQVEDLAGRLLIAPLRDHHVLVASCSGNPPAVADTRALMAALEITLACGAVERGGTPLSADRARDAASPAPSIHALDEILGVSPAIEGCRKLCREYAQQEVPVLIVGEQGTEKLRFARAIHELSPKAMQPLVHIDCATLTQSGDDLTDEPSGSWAGLDLTGSGSIVFENVDQLGVPDQLALLNALSQAPGDADQLRVVSTSNRELEVLVEAGNFDSELYERLSALRIPVPPLRKRSEDVPLLVDALLLRCSRQLCKEISGVAPKALDALVAYSWPGNERELRREMARVGASVAPEEVVDLEHLNPTIAGAIDITEELALSLEQLARLPIEQARDTFERWMIARVLDDCHGNQTLAAEQLGMSRAGLFKKAKRLGLKD